MASYTMQLKTRLFDRNFTLLWIGMSISVIGDFIYNTSLVLWIGSRLLAGVSWAPLAISGIFFITSIPMAFLGPIAGVFADRWNKRRTMMRMDILRAILVSLLLLVTGIVPLPFFAGGKVPTMMALASIYVIILLAESCGQFFIPSRTVLIKDIVPEEHQTRAMGLSQTVMALALVIGPPVATVLFFTIGVQWTLIVNAVSFVISFFAILGIRPPKVSTQVQTQENHFWQELIGGIKFTIRHKVISSVAAGGAIIMFGAASLNALGYFYLVEDLHSSPTLYGVMDAVLGMGVIIGSLVFSMLADRIGLVRIMNVSLLTLSFNTVIISQMTGFPAAMILFWVFGLAQGALNIAIGPLVLRNTPREFLGRAMTLLNSSVTVASLLGTMLVGYLAGTALVGMHAVVLGLVFTRINTLYFFAGIIAILGSLYVIMRLGWKDPAPVQEEKQSEMMMAVAE